MEFEGRRVAVTGASSGIGLEACREFARRGARVAMVSRNREKLQECIRTMPSPDMHRIYACDVSVRGEAESACRDILNDLGGVDILVNNAGFAVLRTVVDSDTKEIEAQMRTNYLGMVYMTKGVLPRMISQRSGSIINVASVAASIGLPRLAAYCASKYAMLGFSEALRYELRGTGVGVSVISPITVRTPFLDNESFEGFSRPKIALDSGTVARAILRAADSPRLEIMLPWAARIPVWLRQTLPYAINPLIGFFSRRYLG